MNDFICFKPTVGCQTVGELKKALEQIPDNTPLKSQGLLKKNILIRYEEERDNEKNKWITLGSL